MIDIDTVIAIITLAVTAIGLGLQIASYINASKNDRPSSKMQRSLIDTIYEDSRHR